MAEEQGRRPEPGAGHPGIKALPRSESCERMTQTEFGAIRTYVEQAMAGTDPVHDFQHVLRVLWNALDIGLEEKIDRDILIAACLLHDVGRPAEISDRSLCHAEVGSKMAHGFLLSLGWPEARAAWVRDCILTHRYRADRAPESMEAKLLFDADKLDVLGLIGVARTLQYGAMLGDEPLYRLDGMGQVQVGPKGEPSFFQEYDFKLRTVPEKLLTRRGREKALILRAEGDRFYDALLTQLRDCLETGRNRLSALGLYTIEENR